MDSNSFGEEDYESIKNKRTNFCCNSVFNLAELAGKRLIELGETVENSLKWAMDPYYPRYMSNFSHGTAGIVYFFCTGIQISDLSVAGSISGEGMLRYFSITGPTCS